MVMDTFYFNDPGCRQAVFRYSLVSVVNVVN